MIKQDFFAELKVADQKGRILLGSHYAGKRFAIHEEADGTAVLTPVVIVAGSEADGVITARRLADRFAVLVPADRRRARPHGLAPDR